MVHSFGRWVSLGGFVAFAQRTLHDAGNNISKGSMGGIMMGKSALRAVAPEGDNQLVIEGVSKKFGGVVAVQGVSLDVPRGSILSIIGPNGAGKTSLLNMISAFYKPDTSRVLLEGLAGGQHEPGAEGGPGMQCQPRESGTRPYRWVDRARHGRGHGHLRPRRGARPGALHRRRNACGSPEGPQGDRRLSRHVEGRG